MSGACITVDDLSDLTYKVHIIYGVSIATLVMVCLNRVCVCVFGREERDPKRNIEPNNLPNV